MRCAACRTPYHRPLHALIPLVRAVVRYAPWQAGRRWIWLHAGRPLAHHSHHVRARTVDGIRLAGNQRQIVPRSVYWFGTWEPAHSRWIRETLGDGDVYVDIGANIGYCSLLAAVAVAPTGAVVAVEPSPSTFVRLADNLAANAAVNVRAVEAAVSAKRGAIQLYRASWDDAASSTVPLPGTEREALVPAMPLAELLTAEELARVRLIKIDVEGSELDVLRGVVRDLHLLPPFAELVVEAHPQSLALQGSSIAELVAEMARAGFAAYALPVDFSALAHLDVTVEARPVAYSGGEAPTHLIFTRTRNLADGRRL